MTVKNNKYFFMTLQFIGLLFFLGFIVTRLDAADNAAEQEVLLGSTGLEQRPLSLVSSSPWVVEGQTLGEALVYDDANCQKTGGFL